MLRVWTRFQRTGFVLRRLDGPISGIPLRIPVTRSEGLAGQVVRRAREALNLLPEATDFVPQLEELSVLNGGSSVRSFHPVLDFFEESIGRHRLLTAGPQNDVKDESSYFSAGDKNQERDSSALGFSNLRFEGDGGDVHFGGNGPQETNNPGAVREEVGVTRNDPNDGGLTMKLLA